MKFKNLVVAAVLFVGTIGWAQEEFGSESMERPPKTELQMGDLADNAFTTFQGTTILHPFLPSSFAISDNLEVKSSFLGWFSAANLSLEYAIIKNKNTALSIEPSVATVWQLAGLNASALLRFSQRAGGGFFNLNAGATFSQNPLLGGVTVPLSLGYSLVASPHTIWDFHVNSVDALTLAAGYFLGSGGVSWNHSFGGIFQLGLGVNAFVGTFPTQLVSILNALGINYAAAVFIAPDVTLTFKF